MSHLTNKTIKETVKHSIIYGTGQIIPQVVGFILLPIFARYLSVSEFGVWSLLQSIINIAISFFAAGLDTSCLRSYYDYEQEEKRQTVVGTTILIILGMILLINGLVQPVAKVLSKLVFNSSNYVLIIRIITITTCFRLLNSIPFVIFRAKRKSKLFITLQSILITLRLSSMVFSLVVLKYGVLGLVLADLIVTGFGTFVLYFFIHDDVTLKFDKLFAKQLLGFGLPLIPGRFFYSIIDNIDRYFIANFISLSSVGIYFVGFKISQVLSLILVRPLQLIFPAVAFSLKKASHSNDYYKRFFTYYVFVGFFLCLAIATFSSEILLLMGKDEYLEAVNIIPVLLLSFLFAGLQQNLNITLFIERKTFWVPIVVCIGCVINVVMNIMLIPTLKLFGAALVKLFTRFSMAAIWYFLAMKYNRINYEWLRIVKIIFVTVIIYSSVKFVSTHNFYINIIIKTLLLISFPLLLFFVGFYLKEEKMKIIKLVKSMSCLVS